MAKIALFGAGGKMGRHLTFKLRESAHEMRYVEISESGIDALRKLGVDVTSQEDALTDADVVIFALPDALVGRVSNEIVPELRAGTMVLMLDVAAALAGVLCVRSDIAYFFVHPSHGNILRRDRTGQHIICALMQGCEEDYALGVQIGKEIHAPVSTVHRLTVEQMGLLEPALAETIGLACLSLLRDATDEVIKQGIPRAAAEEFLLGHLGCLSYFFADGALSDGAILALERGKQRLFRDDWRKLLTSDSVLEQCKAIVSGGKE